MSTEATHGTAPGPTIHFTPSGNTERAEASPLPTPQFERGLPTDALSQLLLALEVQNQDSLRLNIEELQKANDRLSQLQQELADALKKALDAARKSEKKQGWFSKTFGSMVDAVAKVVAKYVELCKDVVVLPADMTMSFARNMGDREALMQSLRHDLAELCESGETEGAVAGFVSGTAKFAGDLMTFQAVLVVALAEGAANRESLGAVLKERGTELWHSLQSNILENPEFWTVAERLVQAVAVAAVVASGGLAAPIAVGLVLAIEADNRYGFVEDIAGKQAAPWVRLGMRTALAVTCSAGAGQTNDTLRLLQLGTGVVQGAGTAYQGVRHVQESKRRAEALDDQAGVQEKLNQIQETQRLIDALIELYEERSQHRTRSVDGSVQLLETQANTERALVIQG